MVPGAVAALVVVAVVVAEHIHLVAAAVAVAAVGLVAENNRLVVAAVVALVAENNRPVAVVAGLAAVAAALLHSRTLCSYQGCCL